MEPNLTPLERMIKNNPMVENLISFNLEKGVMIADLVHFKVADFLDIRETYQIVSDGDSYLLFFYPNASTFIPDGEDNSPLYYEFDSFEEIPEILNEVLVKFNEGNVLSRYSKKLTSPLPEWAVLKPRYIHKSYINFFINSLSSHINFLDVQKDLTKDERKLLDTWFKLEKNQAYQYF